MGKIRSRLGVVATALAVGILIIHSGCSRNLLERFTGQWQRIQGNDTIEFKADRSFSVSISHSIPFMEDINHAQTSVTKGNLGWRADGTWGWTVELGKLVVPYSVAAFQRVRVMEEPPYRDKEVTLRYGVSKNDDIPTAHMPFRTGADGNIEILSEVDGEPVTRWKASGSPPLRLEVELNGQWSPLEGALFKVESVDSDLRQWQGTLSLTGSLELTEKGEFIAYVPVQSGNLRLQVFQGSLVGEELSLISHDIQSISGRYARVEKKGGKGQGVTH